MNGESVPVFFYGLFMDRSLLASKGIQASEATVGSVSGYGLRIGFRATLVRDEASTAYGVIMSLPAEELDSLYSEASVADYVPESVAVEFSDGTQASALCYILPESQLEGTNPQYARSLLTLAAELGLPDEYLQQIETQIGTQIDTGEQS